MYSVLGILLVSLVLALPVLLRVCEGRKRLIVYCPRCGLRVSNLVVFNEVTYYVHTENNMCWTENKLGEEREGIGDS